MLKLSSKLEEGFVVTCKESNQELIIKVVEIGKTYVKLGFIGERTMAISRIRQSTKDQDGNHHHQ